MYDGSTQNPGTISGISLPPSELSIQAKAEQVQAALSEALGICQRLNPTPASPVGELAAHPDGADGTLSRCMTLGVQLIGDLGKIADRVGRI